MLRQRAVKRMCVCVCVFYFKLDGISWSWCHTLPSSLQQLMQDTCRSTPTSPCALGMIWTRWKSLASITMLQPAAYACIQHIAPCQSIRMNEYFIHQHKYNTKNSKRAELCRLDRKAQRALTTALEDTLMKEHTAVKQNVKKIWHPKQACQFYAAF